MTAQSTWNGNVGKNVYVEGETITFTLTLTSEPSAVTFYAKNPETDEVLDFVWGTDPEVTQNDDDVTFVMTLDTTDFVAGEWLAGWSAETPAGVVGRTPANGSFIIKAWPFGGD